MRIRNFTPHVITVIGMDGNVFMKFPSEGVARLEVHVRRVGMLMGIPLTKSMFGDPTGLPDQEDDVFLIVSQLVLTALPDRDDLLVPSELLRDGEGNIIGCKSLGINGI